MKKSYLTLFFLISGASYSQVEDDALFDPTTIDHLEPLMNYGVEGLYSEKIVDHDFLKKNEYPIIQFLKFPACDKSKAMTLIGSNENDIYKIAYTYSTKPLKQSKKRHIKTLQRNIGHALASKLQLIYELVLINTHYSLNSQNVWMLDCSTTYHFYGYGPKYRPMYGGAVNPLENSPPDTLIKISERLETFVEKGMDENELIKEVNQALANISAYKSSQRFQ